ncbi:hypothetical protein [uncultured Tolumonas sp.]|uniref:hypothetical protein n=1 Tax=uncultured Tolumonas sp. TaxID=263765 RepID=UPI00293159AA|nr:hypothetical protein [uncultured Tolumonas sp.]
MRFKIISALALTLSMVGFAHADAPVEDGSWQWNKNVKIDFVYAYWENAPVHVHMNNGEFCYILPGEKELLSTVLAMRAQQSVGELVCAVTADKNVDGRGSRHLHRIHY